jgi:propanol-preferring alcohol dehydrogenase
VPAAYEDARAAPLLCAGLIGYRALRLVGDAERLGLYGFGSSAHIIAQVARWEGRRSSRSRARATRRLAPSRGSSAPSGPRFGRAATGGARRRILFAPAGELVPAALRVLAKGGTVVAAGIHMSDVPAFPYDLLWGERSVRSVANLTRADGREFLKLAPRGARAHGRRGAAAFPGERRAGAASLGARARLARARADP